MLIDLKQKILDYKGEEVIEQVQEMKDDKLNVSARPLTLKNALLTALNTTVQNEMYSVDNKVRANDLSLKIWNNDEVDFSPEDIVFMKERAGVVWNTPAVYVAVINFLDNKSQKN
jgi:hypothetical protein